jgi:hypothetical protein
MPTATSPAGPTRFGPSTAPIVVAHTTVDSARALSPAAARSVAAKRDCEPAAVADPRSAVPISSSGNDATVAATVVTTAPAAPRR